jgi:probable rRNA maturation factor
MLLSLKRKEEKLAFIFRSRMINIFYEDVVMGELDLNSITVWLSGVCVDEGRVMKEINVIFCSDDYLLQLNRDYLAHDYYTDIITFDYCEGDSVVGDLFISKDRVVDNAVELVVPFLEELHRVMVHGILHLCGYGDKDSVEKTLMRQKEDFYLKRCFT